MTANENGRAPLGATADATGIVQDATTAPMQSNWHVLSMGSPTFAETADPQDMGTDAALDLAWPTLRLGGEA
jgi:hypothetical protein